MNLDDAVLSAIIYFDIFNYPVTKDEIKAYTTVKLSRDHTIDACLDRLKKKGKIGVADGYYYLTPQKKNVKLRKTRSNHSNFKRRVANFYISIIKIIPTVKLVAITGALAMSNSKESDDIDLLIISSKNRLWTTRFLVNLLLFPAKRSPNSNKQKNKACINILIDESDMQIRDQNLYTAHEIAQMKVVYIKENTYRKFLQVNKWLYKYLPNWKPHKEPIVYSRSGKISTPNSSVLTKIENILKKFQLSYMKSKVTTEVIGETQLFFHPKDMQRKILSRYTALVK